MKGPSEGTLGGGYVKYEEVVALQEALGTLLDTYEAYDTDPTHANFASFSKAFKAGRAALERREKP